MKKRLNAVAILVAVGMTCGSAHSRSLQVNGTAGYLSEWELNGSVAEKSPPGSNEFSGVLVWKHVGLCSVNGPEEKPGEIRFQISKSSSSSRIQAAISLGGAQCQWCGGASRGWQGQAQQAAAPGILTIDPGSIDAQHRARGGQSDFRGQGVERVHQDLFSGSSAVGSPSKVQSFFGHR